MSFLAGFSKRAAAAKEFYRMVRDKKIYILIPLITAILGILFFMFFAEMPVLIPFFYAVF